MAVMVVMVVITMMIITMVSGDVDADYLLACFNVPEDTRHVAAGGEDLIVVQEPENWIFRKKLLFCFVTDKKCHFWEILNGTRRTQASKSTIHVGAQMSQGGFE